VIGGFVKPGLEAVREESERNFKRRGELGADCAAYHQGVLVVDLWGGYRLGHHLRDDRRGKSLRDALYQCVEQPEGNLGARPSFVS
jgi:hypothetical protein